MIIIFLTRKNELKWQEIVGQVQTIMAKVGWPFAFLFELLTKWITFPLRIPVTLFQLNPAAKTNQQDRDIPDFKQLLYFAMNSVCINF